MDGLDTRALSSQSALVLKLLDPLLALLGEVVLGLHLTHRAIHTVHHSSFFLGEHRINEVLKWAPLTYHYGYEFQNSEPQRMAS